MTTARDPLLPARSRSLYDRTLSVIRADAHRQRLYDIIGPSLVVLLAAFLRLWNLDAAHDLMNSFDETYYVKDAWSLANLGYEGSWPEGANERFLAGDTDGFSADPGFVIHPPLGKWIIAVGMLLVGSETGWGWRLTTALLGTATVLIVMLLARRMTGSTTFAVVAGGLLAIDGLAISMSRVALLDGILTFFVLLAFLFVVIDRQQTLPLLARRSAESGSGPPGFGPVLWKRPWVLAAGVALGAATAVKWSGVWVLAGVGISLVVTDALARRRAGVQLWPTGALRQGAASFLLLVPAAAVTYLASWTGWLVTDGGWDRHSADANPATGVWAWVPLPLQSLWNNHVAMYGSAASITADHPYDSQAWQWPLLARPTSMYYTFTESGTGGCDAANGCAAAISSMPNPLLWYASVAATVWIAVAFVRTRDWRYALILTGLACTYLPWLLFPERTTFQFYTVLMQPFMLLALTFALRAIAGADSNSPGRRLSGQLVVGVFLVAAVVLSAFWYPLVTAMNVPFDFWRVHVWLPGWS